MPKNRIIYVSKSEAWSMGNLYTRKISEDTVAPEKMELFTNLYKQKNYERRNKTRRKKSC